MGAHAGPSRISARDILWRLINIVVAALWVVAAAFHFVDGSFQSVMPGVALLVIGVASIVFEFWRPEIILENCYFLWNFMGRGLCNMGCLVMGTRVINYVSSGFAWFFGLLYIVLWFTSFALFPVASGPRPDV
ncbi:hypothetical protein IWW50_006848 [Coemansia erecta]|nr:hypothetical protein GGF43_003721 [Coemansia sp. RSA 2618]KAJ2815367.1 hypothetical protein IWW50_006848 [Coemansia erecta]